MSVSVDVSRLWCTGVVFMQPVVKVNQLLLFSTPCACKSTELLRHKTLDFTPDVASQQTRPQFCRLDRLLRVIQECVYQKQQGTSNIVDELWLLTEQHFSDRMTHYISQGRAETPVRRGGQLCYSSVANLLQ